VESPEAGETEETENAEDMEGIALGGEPL